MLVLATTGYDPNASPWHGLMDTLSWSVFRQLHFCSETRTMKGPHACDLCLRHTYSIAGPFANSLHNTRFLL